MIARTLRDLVFPMTAEAFMEGCWGRSYCHIAGTGDKVEGLFSWGDLGDILDHHRLDGNRLRLVADGVQAAPERYMTSVHCRDRQIPRLRSEEVTRLFREGHTITLNWVDEVKSSLGAMAENLSGALRAQVYVNAYASLKETPGFKPHYDDHDVIILQVSGQKHWRLYGVRGTYPLTAATDDTEVAPERPEWEGVLKTGDVLYMPRGCWHSAVSLGEPTLHLTVGIYPPTGVDFLMWLFSGAPSNELFRMDLPLLQPLDVQAKHMASLETVLKSIWSEDILRRFYDEYSAHIIKARRPCVNFPWAHSGDTMNDHALLTKPNGQDDREERVGARR